MGGRLVSVKLTFDVIMTFDIYQNGQLVPQQRTMELEAFDALDAQDKADAILRKQVRYSQIVNLQTAISLRVA